MLAALAVSLTSTAAFLEAPLLTSRPAVTSRASDAVASAPQPIEGPSTRRELLFTVAAGSAAALSFAPSAAFAESTLVTRQQAYTRYVPRIERGRDFWAGGLRRLIQNKDWAGIGRELEKKGNIQRIFGPMQLWASSWSGKTISDKTLAMSAAIDELRESAATLALCAAGTEADGGMLGFITGPKKLDESKRDELARLSYLKGVSAINKYIEIGNDGLGLNFAALDTID